MFCFSPRRIIFFWLAILSSSIYLKAQSGLTPPPRPTNAKPAIPIELGQMPFALGELLTYNVTWSNFVTAARFELEVMDQGAFFGQEGFQLRTQVATLSPVRSLFLDLDNQYTSYVNTATMLPHRLEIYQGARRTNETIIIDQQNRIARFADNTTLSLPAETYDLTSLVYALRLRGIASGMKQKFTALYGRDTVEIEVKFAGRERITTQAGSFEATRADLLVKGHKKYHVHIWFSNDVRRLPVLITSRLTFGEVRAELASVALNPRPKQQLIKEKLPEGPSRDNEMQAEIKLNRPFSVGEQLNYDVSWANLASVGKVSFAVRQRGQIGDQRVIELTGEASTSGVARSLIDVDDQLISIVEATTLAPVRTEIRLHEGKRTKETVADYNWADSSVRLTNGTHIEVPPGTLDLVSLFYNLRAADLKPNTTHTYALLDANHRLVNLAVRVVKQEAINSVLGTQSALQLDIFSQEQKLIAQAWIGDDARRLPLYIVVRTRFGELRLLLASVVGTH